MIVYRLTCSHGHCFDGWFSDSSAFDVQSSASEVHCPQCDDHHISKAPMAPHIARNTEPKPMPRDAGDETGERRLKRAMERLRREVEKTCEYVGGEFPEEARRIHYGETAVRGIYGEASKDEASSLIDEGIEIQHIPWLPRRDD